MPIKALPSTPNAERSRIAAQVCLASSAAFMVLLAALHVLKPDLDPSWRFISEYELGDHGWLMRVAFFSLALSCISLCVAIIPHVRGVVGYLGMALVLLAACGMILAGIFAPDKDNKLHEVGAMLDHLPFAALMINWSLSRHSAWSSARPMLRWTAGLPLLGLVIFVGSMVIMLPRNNGQPGPTVLVGWPNRIMILAHCAWLMPLAWNAMQLNDPSKSPSAGAAVIR